MRFAGVSCKRGELTERKCHPDRRAPRCCERMAAKTRDRAGSPRVIRTVTACRSSWLGDWLSMPCGAHWQPSIGRQESACVRRARARLSGGGELGDGDANDAVHEAYPQCRQRARDHSVAIAHCGIVRAPCALACT